MSFSDPVGATARWIAAARAVETRRPDRLFNDPWAESLAGDEGFELLRKLGSASRPPGAGDTWENPYLAIRTRFIDDFLLRQLESTAARQVVMLASGLDTRAERLEFPVGTKVFELDRREVLEFKDLILRQAGVEPRCERRTIAVDLTQAFGDPLVALGFNLADPSLWVVEGLLPYLTESQAQRVLAECANLAKPGSALVADLAGRSFLESPWVQRFLQALEDLNAPWRFGTDEPERFFAAFAWRATARRPGEDGAHYGRWPYPVATRGTPGIPQAFFVTAVRDGNPCSPPTAQKMDR